ncbi:unnamed protein product [Brassicogethes aeneus]|uniref:F-box domain-containing protein n=1 Tax=Brassicogethes aeneus TaxID=1431903 RepID=A0A9P0AS25_BRAAE|nr:unnamed protein product [Brassicogethes aeneus]
MEKSCPNGNELSQICSINEAPGLPKQDCSSPSPTETLCLDSICPNNEPGMSQSNSGEPLEIFNLKQETEDDEDEGKSQKTNFLNELGLEQCEDDNYEWDHIDRDLSEIIPNDIAEEDEISSCEEITEVILPCASHQTTPKSAQLRRSTSDTSDRRKRKLDLHHAFPNKKLLPEGKSDSCPLPSCTSCAPGTPRLLWSAGSTPKTRAVIPTKDNPPPEMSEWLTQFQFWSNAERIMAINELIARCEPTQVRHMMQVIEPQFQRDFISLLPKELALNVLSFLDPRDLLRAAQTCRSWRFLADDNLLWKEKCKQAGIDDMPRKRCSPRSPSTNISPWKAAYMRQNLIELNWRSRPIRPPKMLKGHDDHVITCLQFCGNRIVSGSDDNTLKVWSATTGKCLRTLVGHTGGVWSSQMSGSTIISGSTDRTLKVWDADTGVCIHTLYGHTSTVRCMHLHGKKVVSGSRDATLRVWDIETGSFLHVLVGHLAAVRCVQYDGRLVVSGAYDYMVKVWNPETEECLHTLQGHTNRVYSLQFDGVHVVSGSLDTSIRVWEVETGQCKHMLIGHQSLTSGMELRNNILVSGNADSTVKVWDIVTGQCLQTLSGPYKHQSAVTCLQFNSRFVITSSDDGTVKLWDVRTGDFIRNLVALDSGGSGGVVWRIRASDTKLVCAVGSRNGTEETKLLVLDFDIEGGGGALAATAR